MRIDEIERRLADQYKFNKQLIDAIIDADRFFGDSSLITKDVQRQISIFLRDSVKRHKQALQRTIKRKRPRGVFIIN